VPNPNSLALIVSEISAFIRTDGQTDMTRSTRLVILIKNIYTLWGRKRFLLPVTFFLTNLVYPFTLRVTGITWKNAIVEYLDYQIPVTQPKGQKGNGDMQARAAKTSMVAPSIVLIVCGLNLGTIAIVSLIYKH